MYVRIPTLLAITRTIHPVKASISAIGVIKCAHQRRDGEYKPESLIYHDFWRTEEWTCGTSRHRTKLYTKTIYIAPSRDIPVLISI